MPSPIQVPDTVWFSPTDASPAISTAFAALDFVLQAGQSPIGPTTVLSASYMLGWPYVEIYGGNQLPKPIVVVAIDASSGKVFLSDLNVVYLDEEQDAIIIGLSDDEINQGGPVANIPGQGGYFNVDLCALLGLPPESAYYQVFLWLDDLVTPIQTVQVPANPNRVGRKPGLYQVTGSNFVSVRTSSLSPNPESGVIRTDLDFDGSGRSFRVYATMPQGSLQNPPTGGAPSGPVLTVLAHCRQTRSFAWYVAPDAFRSMQSGNIPSFDFNPFQIAARPSPAANVFMVTVVGNLRNEVLPILSDYQAVR